MQTNQPLSRVKMLALESVGSVWEVCHHSE